VGDLKYIEPRELRSELRILFLCQYFPPEMGAPSARTFEHARHWVRAGHDVTVVCGLPNHPDGVVPPKYRRTLLYRENIEGINVLRCWLFTTPNRGAIRRSISFITFMFSSIFFGGFFSGRCDVVIATSPQMLCGLGGYIVSRMKRRPFVLEVRDLWPKQIIELGAVRNRALVSFLSWLEMFLYRRAQAIVTVAKATEGEIASRGVPAEKIYTVTNGIEEDFFTVGDRSTALRQAQGWGDKFIAMYVGTFGLSQGLGTLLETAHLLRERDDIHFVLAGTGAEHDRLLKHAAELALENVTFLPMQPKENMPEFYATADICLVPLKNLEVFLYNIPSKMFEIMACARPMILGARGQARALLDEAQAGLPVEPENPESFAAAITMLADCSALRERLARNGHTYVTAHHTRRRKALNFLRFLERELHIGVSPAKESAKQETPPGPRPF